MDLNVLHRIFPISPLLFKTPPHLESQTADTIWVSTVLISACSFACSEVIQNSDKLTSNVLKPGSEAKASTENHLTNA